MGPDRGDGMSILLLLVQVAAGGAQAPPPCPVAEQVLALPSSAPIPHEWVRIYLGGECSGPRNVELYKRVKNDQATMRRVIRILRGRETDTTLVRRRDWGRALQRVSDDGPPTILDLLLRLTERAPATLVEEARDGGAFGIALLGLARYAAISGPARLRLERYLRADLPEVRQQAFQTLLHINNEWARSLAARVPVRDLGFYDRNLLATVLREPACQPGAFWSLCHGFEGQVYKGCAAWPLPCRIDHYGA